MNAVQMSTRQTKATRTPQQAAASDQKLDTRPSLRAIVRSISADAKHDSLKYVLRSDTGHDGE